MKYREGGNDILYKRWTKNYLIDFVQINKNSVARSKHVADVGPTSRRASRVFTWWNSLCYACTLSDASHMYWGWGRVQKCDNAIPNRFDSVVHKKWFFFLLFHLCSPNMHLTSGQRCGASFTLELSIERWKIHEWKEKRAVAKRCCELNPFNSTQHAKAHRGLPKLDRRKIIINSPSMTTIAAFYNCNEFIISLHDDRLSRRDGKTKNSLHFHFISANN